MRRPLGNRRTQGMGLTLSRKFLIEVSQWMSLLEVCEEPCHMQHRVTKRVIKNHQLFYIHVRCSPPKSLSSIAHAHLICLHYTYCTMQLDFTIGVWISANGIALRSVGGGEVRVAESGGEVRAGTLRSGVFASSPACCG